MGLKVRFLEDELGEEITEEGYRGVNSVWLARERGSLREFSSRIFRIEIGGHTSTHAHEREHIALVIKGSCLVECANERILLGEGSLVEIPSGAPHRFLNPGQGKLHLLIMNLTPAHGERS
ncbi:MAG: cupin domain-containing protein [Candidatus Bathyarchaeia archaeon]